MVSAPSERSPYFVNDVPQVQVLAYHDEQREDLRPRQAAEFPGGKPGFVTLWKGQQEMENFFVAFSRQGNGEDTGENLSGSV